jgi:hypothetical protein
MGSSGFSERTSITKNATKHTALGPVGDVGDAVWRRLRERVHQRDKSAGRGDRPRNVVGRVSGCLRFLDDRDGCDDGDERDRHVDQEAPTPREVFGQEAAKQQADRCTATRNCAVYTECLGALLGFVERHREQRKGSGREHCGKPTLQGSSCKQESRTRSNTTQGRSTSEADQSDDEHALASRVVGDTAAKQEQTAERQRVRRHHPLLVGVGDVQRMLRRGQREVDDGRIQDNHQLSNGYDPERFPTVRIERGGRLRDGGHHVLRVEGDYVVVHGFGLLGTVDQ